MLIRTRILLKVAPPKGRRKRGEEGQSMGGHGPKKMCTHFRRATVMCTSEWVMLSKTTSYKSTDFCSKLQSSLKWQELSRHAGARGPELEGVLDCAL